MVWSCTDHLVEILSDHYRGDLTVGDDDVIPHRSIRARAGTTPVSQKARGAGRPFRLAFRATFSLMTTPASSRAILEPTGS